MASNYTFDLGEVNLSVCSIPIDGGGAADGFVTVSLPKMFDAASGVHGDSVSFRTGEEMATFQINLLEADPVVPDLVALVNSDIDAANGAGVGAFLLENLGTGLEVRGDCRLDGYPSEIAFANSAPGVRFEGKIFGVRVDHRDRAESA